MIRVDARLLRESPELRKKVREVNRLEKEARMRIAFRGLLAEGESYGHALEAVAEFYSASPATVKRAARGLAAPPWPRRADRRTPLGPPRPEVKPPAVFGAPKRPARSLPWLPLPLDLGSLC